MIFQHITRVMIDIATFLRYRAAYHDNMALSCLKTRHGIAMAGLEEVEAILCGALAEHRGVPLGDVRAGVDAGGEIDSLEGVELIIAAEAHFGIKFSDNEITPQLCRSIPDLSAAVAAK